MLRAISLTTIHLRRKILPPTPDLRARVFAEEDRSSAPQTEAGHNRHVQVDNATDVKDSLIPLAVFRRTSYPMAHQDLVFQSEVTVFPARLAKKLLKNPDLGVLAST
jgi:hypothetical protein